MCLWLALFGCQASVLIMGTSVCLDCVVLPFNSLWLQCHIFKLLSMENSHFPERLKTANPVNRNYLLLKVIMLEHLRK